MSAPRLQHLLRQKALLEEHLAWINAEIAREPGADSLSVPQTRPAAAESPAEADLLMERYASDQRHNPRDIRRGCMVVFAAALALLTGAVALVWMLYYR